MTELERPSSPTQEAKRRAANGAAAAAAAARAAGELNWRTKRSSDTRELFNTKVPRVALSDSAIETERARTAPPAAVPHSPYCQDNEGGAQVAPAVHSLGDTIQLQAAGMSDRVDTIHLSECLSAADASTIANILSDPHTVLKKLSLANAFLKPIDPDPSRVAAAAAVLREEFPESSEETAEKLQAAVEKFKGEYTTYAKGIEYLAQKRSDPYLVIMQVLADNRVLRELRLDNNALGAVNDEGRASFQPLRRLGKMIDANSSLRVLDLSGNQMGPVGVGIVAKALTKNIAIHSLDISGNDVAGEGGEEDEDPEVEEEDPVFGELAQGLEALSEVIKKNKFLRKLSMRHNRLKAEIDEAGEDDGVDTPLGKFLEPLKKYHRLQVLDLSSNELGAGGARMVANALLTNRSVLVLDMSDNNLTPRGLVHLSSLVQKSSVLQSLVLQKNDLSGKKGKRAQKEAHSAMLQFASALRENTSLTSLNVAGNHLGPELAADFLSTIAEVAGRLRSINLESNELCGGHLGEYDDRAISCLAAALGSEACALQDVNLAGNYIQALGMQTLTTTGTYPLHSVTTLNLSRNGLGDDGVALLGNCLPNLGMLTDINLAHNNILDPTPLTMALRTNPSIRHVQLSHNLLGDCKTNNSLVELIDVIGGKPQYETLDLSYNELRDDHAKALAYLCHTATPPFQTMLLQGNPSISIDETIKMLQALARNTSIRVFKTTAQDQGDHLVLLQCIQQTLMQNKTLEDIDVGLSLDVLDEQVLISEIKQQLLQNALNNATAGSLQSTFQPF